jgi:O-antigen ligase
MEKLKSLLDQTIYIIFLALTIITPLLFTTQTTEIYEIPKMYFVYFASTILLALTITKFIIEKKIKIPTGAVVMSLTIFIFVQVISTLFSQDKYTSIFGYPTRLNGGLISQFAYLVIFATGLINLNTQKVKSMLLAIVFAATAVSVWGIPSHFGADPSCYVLTGKLTSACWQKEFDPTLRIFSTLGQPNWLASYLVLILPLSLAFSLFYQENKAKLIFAIASSMIFFSIILTNSRAGLLGLVASLAVFAALLGIKTIKTNIKFIATLGVVFIILTAFFATNLTSRLNDLFSSQKQTINQPVQNTKPTQSSLTSGGTESGQIRLIIWQGAIDVFKSSPLLGTGPETFVSSYYKFRPQSHNQTTEWQFFYNKAHNEFLNYAANTGLLGLLSYLAFLTFLTVTIFKFKNTTILDRAILAGITGYLLTIFFGFSTVATQSIFFLFAAAALVVKTKFREFQINFLRPPHVQKTFIAITLIAGLYICTIFARLYFAETLVRRAQNASGTSELIAYRNAITTSPVNNPYIASDFAYAIASYISDITNKESKSKLIGEVDNLEKETSAISQNNYLISQRIAKTYLLISQENPVYQKDADYYAQKLTQMAPTNPESYLILAKIQISESQNDQAVASLKKALELKQNYVEAQQLLEELSQNPLQ